MDWPFLLEDSITVHRFGTKGSSKSDSYSVVFDKFSFKKAIKYVFIKNLIKSESRLDNKTCFFGLDTRLKN